MLALILFLTFAVGVGTAVLAVVVADARSQGRVLMPESLRRTPATAEAEEPRVAETAGR